MKLLGLSLATGLIAQGGPVTGLVWLIATGLFLAVVVVMNVRLGRHGGVKTGAGRAVGAVWSGVGYGIFALFSAIAVIGYRLGESAMLVTLAMIPSIIMVFYGVGWAVTATMQKSSQ